MKCGWVVVGWRRLCGMGQSSWMVTAGLRGHFRHGWSGAPLRQRSALLRRLLNQSVERRGLEGNRDHGRAPANPSEYGPTVVALPRVHASVGCRQCAVELT